MKICTRLAVLAVLLAALCSSTLGRAETPKEIPSKGESKKAPLYEELMKGFIFGSYGRIAISSDLREGSRGKSVNVVSRGPRLEEAPYAELNLGYRFSRGADKMGFSFLFTLALLEDVFHYNGKFEAKLAIRNLFLQVDNVFTKHLSLWAGSRMYRGDDIYQLDFWPLDDLNTLGAGAKLSWGKTFVYLHAGVNRLDDPYQRQILQVPTKTVTTEDVEILDRQRTVVSAKVIHELHDVLPWLSMKLVGYGELHALPKGNRRIEEQQREELPADFGWVAGAQLGFWGFGRNSFANLFVRIGGGLGAYDELEVPSGLGPDKRATNARELRIGLSANYEHGRFGLLAGGYLRYFRDGDGVASDPDDGWEYVLALRPMIYITRHFHQMFEVSLQSRRPDGLDPNTNTHLVPTVAKFSVMPALSWDRGSYARPQLRVVYTLSYLDAGARQLFREDDPRHGRAIHHYLGVQVEWWYNSAYR